MSILVIAEHNHKELNSVSFNTLAAARKLNAPVTLMVMGHGCDAVVTSVKKTQGIDILLVADEQSLAAPLAEPYAQEIAKVARDYDYVLAPATTFGKNLLPRAAALCGHTQISDVIEIVDGQTFKRPIYAGNAIETVQSHAAIKFLTIRATAFSPSNETKDKPTAQVTHSVDALATLSTYIKTEFMQSDRPDVQSAKIVVAGGRALKSAENFALLEDLADAMGAAIGASRAAVDAGYVPNDYQIGQTGKIVAPDLYIAVGISGAIQHIAGMKDSRVIVAINNDPNAPIFKIATYGLVGDLFEIVPELTSAIKAIH